MLSKAECSPSQVSIQLPIIILLPNMPKAVEVRSFRERVLPLGCVIGIDKWMHIWRRSTQQCVMQATEEFLNGLVVSDVTPASFESNH